MKANSVQAALEEAAETRAIAGQIAALNLRDRLPGFADRQLARLAEVVSIGRAMSAPIDCKPFTLPRRQWRDNLATA